MLNLNFNIIECQRRTIAPILANDFNYFLIGGGAGGSGGGVTIGGNGGQGGRFSTGSISVNHLSTFTITIGNGGDGGNAQGASGTNGGQTLLDLDSSLVSFASGGIANFNSGQDQNLISVGTNYDYYNSGLWAGDGTKGGDSPVGATGQGGGTDGLNTDGIPWLPNPTGTSATGAQNTGGGGGGRKWGEFPGGNGAKGVAVLSFLDPRDVFTYSGDYSYFEYDGNRKYFYYLNNGTFTLFGKRG